MRTRHLRLVAVWLCLWSTACGHPDHAPADPGPTVAVSVVTAHEESLPLLYRASGTVRGRSTIVLTSKVAGYVRAVHVHAGDSVTAGQVLVDLEANDSRAGVSRDRAEVAHAMDVRAEADSNVAAARVTAQLAHTNHDRSRKLFDEGAITKQALDQSEAEASSADAHLAAAEARLRGTASAIDVAKASLAAGQVTLDYARVTAPFSGRVIDRRVDPGALASIAMPLLVLDDGASLRVEAAVEESRGSSIRIGDRVDVELASRPASGQRSTSSSVVEGKVGEIVPTVDVASRAFVIKVDLPASVGGIQPGTFARVGFASGTRARLVVPTTAVSSLGSLDRVYVVDGDVARLRMVALGDVQGPWTEVLSGLSANERVVADPAKLRDGSHVQVKP